MTATAISYQHQGELPSNYPMAALKAFHQRDPQAVGEEMDDKRLRKAVIWQQAGLLSIEFSGLHYQANFTPIDDSETQRSISSAEFQAKVERMLGLDQPVDQFEQTFADHPELGGLLKQQAGLRVPQTATRFEALTWAITGQQISVAAAVAARRKLIQLCGTPLPDGLICYPDAAQLARFTLAELRAIGFSESKARTLVTISQKVCEGELRLDEIESAEAIESLGEQLRAIKGIGPWTVNYTLLRGFGYLNGSLHGDAAVRRNLQRLLNRESPLTPREAEDWLAQFQPWRALVANHLWAMQSDAGY